MDIIDELAFKQRKYIPVFPKATGKPTIYIEGYPCEDDEPMGATGVHSTQITTFHDQLVRYFETNEDIYVGADSFIYYLEGDIKKCVAPDVFIVLGVARMPPRDSFYTWEEGAVPTAVFEFLSDSTANRDRYEKVRLYLTDMGVEEYFIHQPQLKNPPELRGWRRNSSGSIVEIEPDGTGGLFSESLNLGLRWEEQNHIRLLRPYLPDGTPITTSSEEQYLRLEAEAMAAEEAELRQEEARQRREEARRRREAETRASAEAERRQEVEAELERLRAQLANRQDQA